MVSPSVFVAWPPASLFAFPPHSRPEFIAPPAAGSMPSAPAWVIAESVYLASLDPKVPLTLALLYTLAARLLNAYNRARGGRAWWIARTAVFARFLVAHNLILTLYSAWTWWGMLGALRRSLVSPLGGGPGGVAGLVDSVCRLHGPAGLGSGVFYDEAAAAWETHLPHAVLASDGHPSRHDGGRLWNEGLAFYGWLFYISKFYELLDTFIILAKGRLSSTLQTYHHAGAILCMWAGMRYMSPPIWIFVFANSAIHTIMYTYYTLTALHIRVPLSIKRALTTMQIMQFIVGASCALLHSFVYYTVPTRSMVPCITTTGATMAVWLNVLYLAPLTYLFAGFFVDSYLTRSSSSGGSDKVQRAEKAGWDAAGSVERKMYGRARRRRHCGRP